MSTRLKSIASSCATATLLLVAYGLARPTPETPERASDPVQTAESSGHAPIAAFLALQGADASLAQQALKTIRKSWSNGDAMMLMEASTFCRNSATRRSIKEALSEMTGQSFVESNDWYHWIWDQTDAPHPQYATFKKTLYSRIDSRFAEYFDTDFANTIRLDEIRWGGVRRDGIPPLKNPETVAANKADYLADSDIVFGVEFAGHARAYPKRILAWHEMVKDTVGDQSINGVYCTLCGSMIVYDTQLDGKHYELGTSGFLYRSNKLMYDHETKSMWSTLKGIPVVGPLVGKQIKLRPKHVVTTTWGKWKKDHPETDVLTLNTGHRRDYGEGVAYHDYFATDDLMFTVPKIDTRLKNKQEVFTIRLDDEQPIAISTSFLQNNRVHHEQVGDQNVVVLTDESGANRAYETGGQTFKEWADPSRVIDVDHNYWQVSERGLQNENSKKQLRRLPGHRSFWFGWHSTFPKTRLVH